MRDRYVRKPHARRRFLAEVLVPHKNGWLLQECHEYNILSYRCVLFTLLYVYPYFLLLSAFWHIVQPITVFLFFYGHNNTHTHKRSRQIKNGISWNLQARCRSLELWFVMTMCYILKWIIIVAKPPGKLCCDSPMHIQLTSDKKSCESWRSCLQCLQNRCGI